VIYATVILRQRLAIGMLGFEFFVLLYCLNIEGDWDVGPE